MAQNTTGRPVSTHLNPPSTKEIPANDHHDKQPKLLDHESPPKHIEPSDPHNKNLSEVNLTSSHHLQNNHPAASQFSRSQVKHTSNSPPHKSQDAMVAGYESRLLGASAKNLSMVPTIQQTTVEEIRDKREKERKRKQQLFKEAREAMRLKRGEEDAKKVKEIVKKEKHRKHRDEEIKKVIAEHRQFEAERRKSEDRQYEDYVSQKMRNRQEEIKVQLKGKKQELHEHFKKLHEDFVQKQKKEAKKYQEKDLGKSKIKENKNQEYTIEWEQIKKDRETQHKITDMCQSAPMEQIFMTYHVPLTLLYNYFSHVEMDPYLTNTSGRGGGGALGFRTFFALMNMFEILGPVVEPTEMRIMYKNLTHGKKIGGRIPVGLTFEQFKEMLFRIAVRRKDFFVKSQQENKKTATYLLAPIQFIDITEPSFHLYKDIEKEHDDYPGMAEFRYPDLEAFLVYLSLPQTPDEMQALCDNLRKRYFKSKPPRLRELPKKQEYEKLHKVNEIVKKNREKLYGRSPLAVTREGLRSAKKLQDEVSRDRGLRNKSELNKSRPKSQLNKSPDQSQEAPRKPAKQPPTPQDAQPASPKQAPSAKSKKK